MSATHTVDQVFIDELVAATTHVFKTMVFSDVVPGAPTEGDAPRSGMHVVGTVGFTGKTNGLVMFYSTIDVAKTITALMLGIEPAAVNAELPDAIGEMTNMIAGSFRTRMAPIQGDAWAISIPTVTVGSDFCTKFLSGVQRVLCPFQLGDTQVFVELIVTRRSS